jgi:hypothetical protein
LCLPTGLSPMWGVSGESAGVRGESGDACLGYGAYRAFLGLTMAAAAVSGRGPADDAAERAVLWGQRWIDDLRLTGSPHPCPSPSEGRGVLSLTATQPNAEGVVAEILVQELPRVRDWRTGAYLTFAEGSLTQEVPLPDGAHTRWRTNS